MLELVQVLYWLALSTWFGGVLFVSIAAQVVFRTVKESNPILPHVLSVNLEGQHSVLLAGTIMGNLLAVVTRISLICAAALAILLGAEWVRFRSAPAPYLVSTSIRTVLLLGALGIVVYDWRVVWPKIWKYRQEFIDHADEPDVANPASEQFNRYQRESVMLLFALLGLLLALVAFSGAMPRVTVTVPLPAPSPATTASSGPSMPLVTTTVPAPMVEQDK